MLSARGRIRQQGYAYTIASKVNRSSNTPMLQFDPNSAQVGKWGRLYYASQFVLAVLLAVLGLYAFVTSMVDHGAGIVSILFLSMIFVIRTLTLILSPWSYSEASEVVAQLSNYMILCVGVVETILLWLRFRTPVLGISIWVDANARSRVWVQRFLVFNNVACLLAIVFTPLRIKYFRRVSVMRLLDQNLEHDTWPIYQVSKPHLFARLVHSMRARPIRLPSDLERPLAALPGVQWSLPDGFEDSVRHWCTLNMLPEAGRALWVTVPTSNDVGFCATALQDILNQIETVHTVLCIDASKTMGVSAALEHRLSECTGPEFVDELEYDFDGHQSIVDQLQEIWKKKRQRENSGDCAQHAVVVIHGMNDVDQGAELCENIRVIFANRDRMLDFVVLGTPGMFQEISEHVYVPMAYFLSVSHAGKVRYSGNPPVSPLYLEGLFNVLLEEIFTPRADDVLTQQIWEDLGEFCASAQSKITLVNRDNSLGDNYDALSRVYRGRKLLTKLLATFPSVTDRNIEESIREDNACLRPALAAIFGITDYKLKLKADVSETDAYAVLNLVHSVASAGHGSADTKETIVFHRRAQRLVRILSDFVGILPEELAVHGMTLLQDHPITAGGFAFVYQGECLDAAGAPVQVALKVLKITEAQSDDERRAMLKKFAKEALVWHYLRHPNIVPFLGVDGTTFPNRPAMVSVWMPEGSVLKYMAENSPVSGYAISLLTDIADGLAYLHSSNVIHGDLCARNVLVDKGRAMVTDFGLAGFIESESTVLSTRGGTLRWMAPELIHPSVYREDASFKRTTASDVWALACLFCEIWTEGQVPFAHFSDGALILALSDTKSSQTSPYPDKPLDKSGVEMPEPLWDLVESCFYVDAAARPAVADIVEALKRGFKHSGDIYFGRKGKGKARELHSASSEPDVIVHFGPVDLDSDPQRQVQMMLGGLGRSVLVRPLSVEIDTAEEAYLNLRFRSPAEADHFVLLWTAFRYGPYIEVEAWIV